MAVVENVTKDELNVRGVAVVIAGGHVDVADSVFADRAWPKSTWKLVKKPDKQAFDDVSEPDAYIFTKKAENPAPTPEENA